MKTMKYYREFHADFVTGMLHGALLVGAGLLAALVAVALF